MEKAPYHFILQQIRRFVVSVIGFTVLTAGVILLFTPGPAFIVIPLGLGILGIEFVWARRLLAKTRQYIENKMRSNSSSEKPQR